MKYILAFIILLVPTLASAQTSRNPCFLNGTQSSTGIPSCESVSNTAPLPVTVTGSGSSVSISQTTPGTTNGVVSKGGANLATAQVTVAATSTATVAARAGRIAVTITNTGTTDIFCQSGTATITTGDIIVGTKGATKTYQTAAAINCIASTGTQVVTIAESY